MCLDRPRALYQPRLLLLTSPFPDWIFWPPATCGNHRISLSRAKSRHNLCHALSWWDYACSLTAVCFCTKEKLRLATKRKKSSPMLYCPKFCKSLFIFLIPTANILCIPHSPQPCLIGMKNSAIAEKLLFFVTGLMLFGDISRLKSEKFFLT